MHQAKIATCCYCGRRTMLKLTANGGHELACGSCGAPVHLIKPMRIEPSRPSHAPAPKPSPAKPAPKVRKRKRRKPLWRKVVEEVWDEIEDIFD